MYQDDAPFIPLVYLGATAGWRDYVKDFFIDGLSYYRYTFLDEMPKLYCRIEDEIRARWPDAEPARNACLTLGSWIGGDRDGNPFVTAEVTQRALRRQSALALAYYLEQVHELGSDLSQSERFIVATAELLALADRVPDVSGHRRDEPYRRALIGVYSRLAATSVHLDQHAPDRRALAEAAPLLEGPLRRLFADMRGEVLRAKGFVRLHRPEGEELALVELAGRRVELRPLDAEEAARVPPGSTLVFIGEGLDEAWLRLRLSACRAVPPPTPR